MSTEELLARAAVATSRRQALLLVLEAWRQQPCAELSALALALDRDVVVHPHVETAAFIEAAARVKVEERGGLVGAAGRDRERWLALEAWGPDPRVSAFLEDICWDPPRHVYGEDWTVEELQLLEDFRRILQFQKDPLLEAASELSNSYFNGATVRPSTEEMQAYNDLPGLDPGVSGLARSVREKHFAAEHAAVFETPDDDSARLVFADSLQDAGDTRGAFIVEQCRNASIEQRVERHWLGRLAPVLRGSSFGFRRGFVSTATVRFRHRADVEMFGDLPEWRTVENLTWGLPGAEPWRGYIGQSMQLLHSAHNPSIEGLLDAPHRWPRLHSITVGVNTVEQLERLHSSELLPHLESVAISWNYSLNAGWLRHLQISRWKHLELNTFTDNGYESIIEAVEDSSLDSLAFRECLLRRGTDGRLNRLLVRAGPLLDNRSTPRQVSRSLPQGFFGTIEFEDDHRVDETFRKEFVPNMRGQRTRGRPTSSSIVRSKLLAWTEHGEWLFDGSKRNLVVTRAPIQTAVRTLSIGWNAHFSRNAAWVASHADAGVVVYSVQDGERVGYLRTAGHLVAVSDDGQRVLLTQDNQAELWDMRSQALVSSCEVTSGLDPVLARSGSRWAITSLGYDGTDRDVRVVAETCESLNSSRAVSDLGFVGPKHIIGCGPERPLALWDLGTRRIVAERADLEAFKLDVSGDGSLMGCSPDESTWIGFDPQTLESMCELRFEREITGRWLSYDGKQLAVACTLDRNERQLQVFDLTAESKPILAASSR